MAGPEGGPTRTHVLVSMTEKAAGAMSFDRLLVAGLLAALMLTLLLSTVLAWNGDKELAQIVLSYYKDLSLILAGALANSVRHGGRERSTDAA